jgi:uncharacterized protein YdhG (YjbR/CyaY superfamily)
MGKQKSARTTKASQTFTEEERSAMKERASEVRAASRRGAKADGDAEAERAVVAKIAEMEGSDRAMGERLHQIIKASAPALTARLWYGQPAYALNGNVICFFQPAQKFKKRYATLGFSDKAQLDDGSLWPTYYALTELTAENEARIAALIKRAVG